MKKTTPTPKRTLQKSQTRERVLKTAKDLFLEQGYEKTTVRDIAAKARVSTGTVFSHFPDKISLLIATLYRDMDDVTTKAYSLIEPTDPVMETIMNPVKAVYRHFAKTPELSRTWIKESLFAEGPFADLLQSQFKRSTQSIQSFLSDAQKQGRIYPDSDCNVLAEAIMSNYYTTLIMGIWSKWKLKDQVSFFSQMTEALLYGHLVDDPSDKKSEALR